MGTTTGRTPQQAKGTQTPKDGAQATEPNVYFDPELKPSLMGMQRARGGGNSMVREWVAQRHQGPYDRQFAGPDLGEAYAVPRGQLTFDAEGTEGGRNHSRRAHLPPAPSGVTIGRGYDVGQHSGEKAQADLEAAGIAPDQAAAYAAAAGRRGPDAGAWLARNREGLGEITPEQQKALFESTYGGMEADVQRISDKPDTRKAYGDVDLRTTDPAIREGLVDLRYRGDYTTASRRRVQGLAARNDVQGFAREMNDREAWADVPPDRFARRAAKATQGAQEVEAEADLPFTFAAPFERVGDAQLGLDGRPLPKKGDPK